jgi:hypothetical protein
MIKNGKKCELQLAFLFQGGIIVTAIDSPERSVAR